MTNATISPTEPPSFPTHSVGLEDGDHQSFGERVAVLEVPKLNFSALNADVYRDMRWCPDCGGNQVFVEVFEFEGGRVGVCLGCGEERVVRFSRMVA